MRDPGDLLATLLSEAKLDDFAEKVGDALYRLRRGSATVLVGAAGSAVVAVAPMFEALPASNVESFCKRLLALNATMSGMASFAIRDDGAVVLQCGRSTEGLDASELSTMIGTVGKFADDFDDVLDAEFYA